jgi:hypothetical protein
MNRIRGVLSVALSASFTERQTNETARPVHHSAAEDAQTRVPSGRTN